MGGGRWTSTDWNAYATTHVKGRTRAQVFTSTNVADEFAPAKIKVRESRDSADNPAATPIIVGADITGSMHMISESLMRDGLNTLATEIYKRRPVSDPHIMGMAIGDMRSDTAGLQCTQFEADIRVADQIRRLWIEGNGGGNGGESYSGAHLFAGLKTSTDAFEKRGRKGYLFTVGDEPNHDGVTREQAQKYLGLDLERDLTAAECVSIASRTYEVFHVVLRNEGYAKGNLNAVLRTWKPILPERTLILDDHTKLAEVVVSAIQVLEGASKAAVASSWSKGTDLVVANAIGSMAARAPAGVRRIAAS